MSDHPVLAIVGGTGALGIGLATRWARAGYPVVLGSRDADKARATAGDLAAATGGKVDGAGNAEAAARADIVVLAVPYDSHAPILETLRPAVAGKIVVDAVVPLKPPKVSTVQLPAGRSAAEEAQAMLGKSARVVAAFHNVSATKLKGSDAIDCDVLVFGDDGDAREAVVALAAAAGMRGVHAGMLANAIAGEALTAVLIAINRRYKVGGAAIRITGLPAAAG